MAFTDSIEVITCFELAFRAADQATIDELAADARLSVTRGPGAGTPPARARSG